MKIFSISGYQRNPQISSNYNQIQYYNYKLPSLKRDTVSFGQASHSVAHAFECQLSKEINVNRLNRIATTYLDIIEGVATKLKKYGVEFDREYCERSPIKSPGACVSKVTRSGSLKIPDMIRATLYCKNIYDLSVLKEQIIPEFAQRGFLLAPKEVSLEKLESTGYIPTKTEQKRGYVIKRDLDIRLDNEQITKTVPEYASYISKPQDSGYEDIQLRFIRSYDTKENPLQHELIIIPGENYAKAKHYESEKIYKQTRQLAELNFYKNIKKEDSRNMIKRCILLIKSTLSSNISEKLFESAKNIDVYGINTDMQINISEGDIANIKKYFSMIKAEGKKYYDLAEQRARSPQRLKKLKTEHEQDSKKLAEIQKALLESIEFFNKTKTFKKLPEIPKTKPE